MTTTTKTSYSISISADGIWAGSGIYDHRDNGATVSGNIRDCTAVLGGSQAKAKAIYAAIEDAITEMDAPAAGSVQFDQVTYSWTLAPTLAAYKFITDSITATIQAENLEDACVKFAKSEGIAGISSSDELEAYFGATGGAWLKINCDGERVVTIEA